MNHAYSLSKLRLVANQDRRLVGTASPLINEVLRERLWRGDGPPHWTEKRRGREVLSTMAVQANTRRLALAGRLFRAAKAGFAGAEELEKTLSSCSGMTPCMSAACPVCQRAFRRWLLQELAPLLVPAERWIFATVFLRDAFTEPEHLSAESFCRLRVAFVNGLKKAKVSTAAAWIDLSYNIDRERQQADYWAPHVHAILPEKACSSLGAALRAKLSTDERIRKTPFWTIPWDGNLRMLAYLFDPVPAQRVPIIVPDTERRRSHHTTRARPLAKEQSVQAALVLHEAGVQSRLILRGLRMLRTDDGVKLRRVLNSAFSL